MSVFALDKIGMGGKGTVQTADELNCLANEMREYLGTPTGKEETNDSLTIITDESALKSIRQDFISACLLEGYINMGVLELRSSSRVTSTVLCNGEKARSIVGEPSNYVSMDSESESRVSNIESYITSVSEESSKSHLKTAGYHEILQKLEEKLGETVSSQFERIFHSHDFSGELSAVDVLVLLTAHNNEELYQISLVGEETGLASRATFSRSKTRLEDNGCIHSMKSPLKGNGNRHLLSLESKISESQVVEVIESAEKVLG